MIKKIADFVSKIFDPAALALFIVLVAIYKSHMDTNIKLIWSSVVIVFNGVVPFLFYLYFTKKGYSFDSPLNKNTHKERLKIFDVFLIVVLTEYLILNFNGAYQPLLAVFLGGLISVIFALVITYYWKISLHAAVITFFVVMLIVIFGNYYWYSVLLIPIVFWSRLVLNRHTIFQLLGGSLLALIVMLEVFFLYGLI